MHPGIVTGQEADSLSVVSGLVPDSLSVISGQVEDSLSLGAGETPDKLSAGFWSDTRGERTSFGRPAKRADFNLTSLLGSEPGIFRYHFGARGWPDAISPEGGDPNRVGLTLDGIPFEDLVTGRPRYELLPYSLLDRLSLSRGIEGNQNRVHAVSRDYTDPAPQTDLRYLSGADDLTAIDAIHVQNRKMNLFGSMYDVQLLGGYSGESQTGEYAGSRLRSARRLTARIRIARPGSSFELFDQTSRQTIGAHTGVVPLTGQAYETIFLRLGASVGEPEARRTTVRNDLRLRYRTYVLARPLTVSGFWTSQRLSFQNATDTLGVRINRFGLSGEQSFQSGDHNFRLSVMGWLDRFANGTRIETPPNKSASYGETIVGDSASVKGILWRIRAGLHSDDGNVFPSALIAATHSSVSISASHTGIRSTWIERNGFEGQPGQLPGENSTRISRFAVDFRDNYKELSFAFTAFTTVTSKLIVWTRDDGSGEVFASKLSKPVTRFGSYVDLAFRSPDQRGLYAFLRPTVVRSTTDETGSYADAATETTPEFFIHGRIGISKLLFKDDLDLNLYVRGTWSAAAAGRHLDTRSGLLMGSLSGVGRENPDTGQLDIRAKPV